MEPHLGAWSRALWEELRSTVSLFRLPDVTFAKAAFLETDARLCLP